MRILNYNEQKKQLFINDAINDQKSLIDSIKMNYPELKNRLKATELKSINEIIYDLFDSVNQDKYFECMDKLISNSLYMALANDEKFDINIIIKNLFIINKYFNILTVSKVKIKIKKQIKRTSELIKFK